MILNLDQKLKDVQQNKWVRDFNTSRRFDFITRAKALLRQSILAEVMDRSGDHASKIYSRHMWRDTAFMGGTETLLLVNAIKRLHGWKRLLG